MENSRRTLRTQNHCQEINNIFNRKLGENHVIDHIPNQIMKKIGGLQKISCCHINELPQLIPSNNFQLQLQKCRIVQEVQKLGPTEYTENSHMQLQKTTGYEQLSKNISKADSFLDQSLSPPKQQNKRQISKKTEETINYSLELLKDGEFLQILNQFVMFGDSKRAMMEKQLFQR